MQLKHAALELFFTAKTAPAQTGTLKELSSTPLRMQAPNVTAYATLLALDYPIQKPHYHTASQQRKSPPRRKLASVQLKFTPTTTSVTPLKTQWQPLKQLRAFGTKSTQAPLT